MIYRMFDEKQKGRSITDGMPFLIVKFISTVIKHQASNLKQGPAGFVPPHDILLAGTKSMQKCLLLAEGMLFACRQCSLWCGAEACYSVLSTRPGAL